MGLLNLFFPKRPPSAQKAKERLQIVIAHQRGNVSKQITPLPFMDEMKKEILEVVSKYVNISPEKIEANLDKSGDTEILELSINISEREKVDVQVETNTEITENTTVTETITTSSQNSPAKKKPSSTKNNPR